MRIIRILPLLAAVLLSACGDSTDIPSERDITIKGKKLSEHIEALLESKDWDARVTAAKTIGDAGKDAGAAVPALMKVIRAKDADTRLRDAAIGALANMGDDASAVVPSLMDMFAEADAEESEAARSLRGRLESCFERMGKAYAAGVGAWIGNSEDRAKEALKHLRMGDFAPVVSTYRAHLSKEWVGGDARLLRALVIADSSLLSEAFESYVRYRVTGRSASKVDREIGGWMRDVRSSSSVTRIAAQANPPAPIVIGQFMESAGGDGVKFAVGKLTSDPQPSYAVAAGLLLWMRNQDSLPRGLVQPVVDRYSRSGGELAKAARVISRKLR